jgi:hypothetical protein
MYSYLSRFEAGHKVSTEKNIEAADEAPKFLGNLNLNNGHYSTTTQCTH